MMSDQSLSPAPDDIPEHLRREIVNLEEPMLRALQEWLCMSVPSQQESLTEEELATLSGETTSGAQILANLSAEEKQSIDLSEMLGTFTWQFFQCHNEHCRCTSGRTADLHGPYLQRHYLDDSGHYTSEYIPPIDIRQSLVQETLPKPGP